MDKVEEVFYKIAGMSPKNQFATQKPATTGWNPPKQVRTGYNTKDFGSIKNNVVNWARDNGVFAENPRESALAPVVNNEAYTTPKNGVSFANKATNIISKGYDADHNWGRFQPIANNSMVQNSVPVAMPVLQGAGKAFSTIGDVNRFATVANQYENPLVGAAMASADYGVNQVKKKTTNFVKNQMAQAGATALGNGLQQAGTYLGSNALTGTGGQLLTFAPQAGLMVDAALLGYGAGSALAPYTSVPLAVNSTYWWYGGKDRDTKPAWVDDPKYSYMQATSQASPYNSDFTNNSGAKNYTLEDGRTWYSPYLTPEGRYEFERTRHKAMRNPRENAQWVPASQIAPHAEGIDNSRDYTEYDALQHFLALHPEYQTTESLDNYNPDEHIYGAESQQSFLNPELTNKRFKRLSETEDAPRDVYYRNHPEAVRMEEPGYAENMAQAADQYFNKEIGVPSNNTASDTIQLPEGAYTTMLDMTAPVSQMSNPYANPSRFSKDIPEGAHVDPRTGEVQLNYKPIGHMQNGYFVPRDDTKAQQDFTNAAIMRQTDNDYAWKMRNKMIESDNARVAAEKSLAPYYDVQAANAYGAMNFGWPR